MRMKLALRFSPFFLGTLAAINSAPASAAPGVGSKVYGATLEAGLTEIEARYGRLQGGPDHGEDGLVLELAHAFSDKFYAAALIEFEREPGGPRKVEAYSFEAITPIGRVEALKLDIALYGEYEIVRRQANKAETKLLLQHRDGGFDGRINLVAEKELQSGAPVEFGYAASADWAAFGEFRLGLAAFGDLGTTRHFVPRAEHFAGPIVKTEIEHLPGNSELEIEAGYLRAFGAARDDAKGQWRLLLEWETRF
jgi:hypothetical protein